jgi:Ca2+-binding RTX toxin-like protein
VRLSALAAAVLLLGFPAAAYGAHTSIEDATSDFPLFVYAAEAGEQNQAQATFAGGNLNIRDTGATITPGAGCVSVDAHEVNCALAGQPALNFILLDLDDSLTIEGDAGWLMMGGPGADTLTACAACFGTTLGEAGDDTIQNNGCTGCTFYGNAGADTFTGSASRDHFVGGPGNDALNGLGGNDLLSPGAGDDTVDGGAGADDVVDFTSSAVGISADLATGIATGHGTDSLSGIESILGSDRADHLSGDANANRLRGLGGADVLRGRDGADVLTGGAGARNDVLYGGAGNDYLLGREGDDIIRGGSGMDRLLGEGGNDRLGAQDGFPDRVRGGPGFDRGYVDRTLDDFGGIERLFF